MTFGGKTRVGVEMRQRTILEKNLLKIRKINASKIVIHECAVAFHEQQAGPCESGSGRRAGRRVREPDHVEFCELYTCLGLCSKRGVKPF